MPSAYDQTLIDRYDALYGPGNPVSARILESPTDRGAFPSRPNVERTERITAPRSTSRSEVLAQASSTADTRRLEIAHAGDGAGAGDQAREEVQGVLSATRDAEGNRVHGQRVHELENYGATEALFRSMLPQTIEMQTEQLSSVQRDQLQTYRNDVVRGAQSEAMRMADAQDVPLSERAEFIQEQSRLGMARQMNDLWRQLYLSTRAEELKDRGHSADAVLPQAENSEVRMASAARAGSMFDSIVAEAFSDDQQIELPSGDAVFGAAREAAESRPLLMAAERTREGTDTLGDRARQYAHRLVRKRDSVTGEVTETVAGAAIRNLDLATAWVTEPTFQLATWHRDPTTGLPLDPNDINYRIHQWTSKMMEKIEQAQLSPDGFWFKEGDNSLNILKYALLLPAAISGAENITESTMSTGNAITDYAIAHAQGENELTNIASLHALQVLQENLGGYWNWHSTIFGLGAAVAVPAGGFTRASSKIATVGTDALAAIAKGAHSSAVESGLRNLSMMVNTEESWGAVQKLAGLGRNVAEELGIAAKDLVGRTFDGAELVGNRIARKMSDNIAGRVLRARTADDLGTLFPTVKQGSMVDNIIQQTFQEVDRLRKAHKLGLASLKGDDVGQNILNTVGRVINAGPNVLPASQARVVIKSLVQDKVAPFVQKHVTNGWVQVGDSPVIVTVGAWLNHKDEIHGLLKPLLKADLDGTKALYKNGKEAADYLVTALKGDEYNPLWRDTIASMRRGKSIPTAMYTRANDLIRGAVAKSIIKTGVEASAYAAPMAKELAAGRALTKVRAFQDFYKGMRAVLGGKSDYSWVADMERKAGKAERFRPKPLDFTRKSPPVFRKWTRETGNRLAEAPREADRLVRAAVLDPANKNVPREIVLEKVYREMSTGNVADDYQEILEIFFSSKDKTLFGRQTGNLGILANQIDADDLAFILANGGKTVTMAGVRRVISSLSDSVGGSLARDLEGMAIKKRQGFTLNPTRLHKNYNWLKLTDADDLDQLMSGWSIYRMKERVWAKAMKELEEVMPNLLMRVPERAAKLGRLKMLNQALVANGVPASLHQQISNIAGKMLSASDGDRWTMVNQIVGHMFREGGLATGDDLSRITDAVTGTVVKIQGKATGGSFEDIRQILVRATRLDPALGTADDLMRSIFPAVIKASTDLDMNIIRSRFSAFGVESSAAKRSPSGLSLGYDIKPLGGVGRLLYDKDMEDILTRLQQPGQIQKIQRMFDGLRASERADFQRFQDFLDITKRMTVTGLLGGFPLPGTRFMGNNLVGHGLITAVTAPKYIMTTMMNTANAATQSFVRAAKRSGWWASDDVYDFNHARYVAKPDEVLFETVDGEMWTKNMFDDAMDRNNLRFTQISHEFQTAVFEDWVRSSHMGPNGRPLLDYTKLPFAEGTIPRDKFWAFLDPSRKNVWSMMGEEADILQREAIFRAALKNGMGEDVSALLARNSMLDYGSIDKLDPWVNKAKKYIPFFAFRYNMFKETGAAFLRDGSSLQNIVRVSKMVNAQRESMEEWVLQPDYAKNRLFNTLGEDFREWHTINVGIQIPWMEHYVSMVTVGETAMRLVVGNLFGQEEAVGTASLGGAFFGTLGTAAELFLSDPRLDPLMKAISTEPDSNAPQGYFPSPMLEAAAAAGMLDDVVSFFGLEAVGQGKQRPDLPTFDGEQYRISTGPKALLWYSFNEMLLISGVERNIRDYIRLAIRLGIVPEGVEARRDEQGHWLMYGIGGTTYSFPSRWLAEQNARDAAIMTLRDMSKQPTTSE